MESEGRSLHEGQRDGFQLLRLRGGSSMGYKLAGKYGDNNWQNLPDGYNRCKAAMFRHLAASENGEQLDSESGLPHLAHMAWDAIALLHFYMEDLNKKNHD